MAQAPSNYAPVSQFSSVAHLPGQGQGGAKPTGSGRNYIVEFDDALIDQVWWANSRYKGCKTTAKNGVNTYTPEKKAGGIGFMIIGNNGFLPKNKTNKKQISSKKF